MHWFEKGILVKRTGMDIMQISVTFFSTLKLKYTHLKTGPIKSKNMQCTILSIGVIIWNKIGMGTLGGPPGGPGAKGLNQ